MPAPRMAKRGSAEFVIAGTLPPGTLIVASREEGSMQAGDVVADFSATDQAGNPVTLGGLLAEGAVVLFFYPKAMTPG